MLHSMLGVPFTCLVAFGLPIRNRECFSFSKQASTQPLAESPAAVCAVFALCPLNITAGKPDARRAWQPRETFLLLHLSMMDGWVVKDLCPAPWHYVLELLRAWEAWRILQAVSSKAISSLPMGGSVSLFLFLFLVGNRLCFLLKRISRVRSHFFSLVFHHYCC